MHAGAGPFFARAAMQQNYSIHSIFRNTRPRLHVELGIASDTPREDLG
jgi:hypothetical protein